MGNFGDLTLKIYNQSLVLQDTFTNVTKAGGAAYLNRVGNGECTVKVQSGMASLIKGYIAVCYISDAIGGVDLSVCAFTIEEIHEATNSDGMSTYRMSGRDMLGELTGYKHFVDIGDTYPSELGDGMGAGDDEFVPSSTAGSVGSVSVTLIEQNRHAFENDFYVADASAFSVGDDLAGETDEPLLNQISVVTAIDVGASPGGNDVITMADNWVNGPATGKKVYIPEMFKGDTIRVDMDAAAGWHYTRITNDPGPMQIKLEEGIPTGESAASGNTFEVISGQLAIQTDIYSIMELARDNAGWLLDSTDAGTPGGGANGGTLAGTSHTVDGANTLQLLINSADLTSEWFRLSPGATPQVVKRSIDWSADAADASGILLTMPAVQATVHSDYLLTARGLMQGLTAETRWKIATAVVAKGATDNFDLGDKTTADSGDFTTHLVKGKWRVTNGAAGVADWTYVHYVTFGGVEERSSSPASITTAANELFEQAKAYLLDNDDTKKFVQIKRVVLHKDILPGQTIVTGYSETNWTDARTVYAVEVSHSVGADGVRYTDLICSENSPYNRETAESKLVKVSTTGGATSSAGASGGGGGTGETHDAVTIGSSAPPGSLSITGQVLDFQLTPGDGLLASSKILDVDLSTNSGMQFTSAELEMGTPTTLTAGTSNSVTTTTHSHDITTTDDANGTPSTIIAGDSNGRIELAGLGINTSPTGDDLRVDADLDFVGAQSITTTSGDLTIAPDGDLFIDAGGDNMNFDQHVDPQGESYVAAGAGAFTTQWKIDTEEGAAYFKYMEADQFHVRLFQADVTMAKGNGLLITDSVGVISDEFEVPAVSATVPIIVEDNPALGDAQIFEEDDFVRMRAFQRAGGAASLFDLWGQVTSYSDNADATQDWTLTVGDAGVGSGAVGKFIRPGAPILGYGKSGQGWIEFDAKRQQGPFMRIGTWAGANPWTDANRTINLMAGRLLSLTGNDEYGFYAGVSLDGPHMLLTEQTAEFQDISISMLTGTPDGGFIRVYAVELNSDVETAVAPNGDVSQIEMNHGGTGSGDFYTSIDNNPASGQPDADWIFNTASTSGNAVFNLEDISHTLTTLEVEAYVTIHNFSDDKCTLWAQVLKNDSITALTDQVKVASESSFAGGSGGLITIPFTGVDTTASDGEWAAARLLLRWVYFSVGSDEVMTIGPEVGMDIVVEDSSDYSAGRALTLSTSAGVEVGGLYGRFSSGNNYYLRLGTNEANYGTTMHFDDASSIIAIESFSSFGENAVINLNAFEQDSGGSGTESSAQIIMNAGAGGFYDDSIALNTNSVIITGDVSGGTGGLLSLDQGAGDDIIFGCVSSDVDDADNQGMDTAETYFQISKADPGGGGAFLSGASDTNHGIWLRGSCGTVDTTESTSSAAPVIIRGEIDGGSASADENIVVMRNYTSTEWILKDNGDVYIHGSQNTYDDYDDDGLCLAMNYAIAPPDAIAADFRNFTRYNRDDLIRLKLISDGGFVNSSRFQMLHNGTLTQHGAKLNDLYQQMEQLKSELNEWKTNDNRH